MSKTTLFDSRIKKYAYREAAQIYGELSSSPAGLSPEQVEKQREKYGSHLIRGIDEPALDHKKKWHFVQPPQ